MIHNIAHVAELIYFGSSKHTVVKGYVAKRENGLVYHIRVRQEGWMKKDQKRKIIEFEAPLVDLEAFLKILKLAYNKEELL